MATPVQKPYLTESLANYLVAVWSLEEKNRVARVKDIAKQVMVKKASVTEAVERLKEEKLLNYNPYDLISLTEEGRKRVHDIIRREKIVSSFFMEVLGVNPQNFNKTVRRLAYVAEEELLERMRQIDISGP